MHLQCLLCSQALYPFTRTLHRVRPCALHAGHRLPSASVLRRPPHPHSQGGAWQGARPLGLGWTLGPGADDAGRQRHARIIMPRPWKEIQRRVAGCAYLPPSHLPRAPPRNAPCTGTQPRSLRAWRAGQGQQLRLHGAPSGVSAAQCWRAVASHRPPAPCGPPAQRGARRPWRGARHSVYPRSGHASSPLLLAASPWPLRFCL